MTTHTFLLVVLLTFQTFQAFPLTGFHRTHREELVARAGRLFQLEGRVYRRRGEKHVIREGLAEDGSRQHHLQKRQESSHFTECPARYEHYCLNGGRCRWAELMGRASCSCNLTHFGERCERIQPADEDVFGDLRRLLDGWGSRDSETFFRRRKWRRP